MKDPVFDFGIEARLLSPFNCNHCGKILGYAWDAEYSSVQAVCVHPECYEALKKHEEEES